MRPCPSHHPRRGATHPAADTPPCGGSRSPVARKPNKYEARTDKRHVDVKWICSGAVQWLCHMEPAKSGPWMSKLGWHRVVLVNISSRPFSGNVYQPRRLQCSE